MCRGNINEQTMKQMRMCRPYVYLSKHDRKMVSFPANVLRA